MTTVVVEVTEKEGEVVPRILRVEETESVEVKDPTAGDAVDVAETVVEEEERVDGVLKNEPEAGCGVQEREDVEKSVGVGGEELDALVLAGISRITVVPKVPYTGSGITPVELQSAARPLLCDGTEYAMVALAGIPLKVGTR